jgi:PAS domain S-box-containing protein
MELRLVRADGSFCESEIAATVMTLDGKPAIIVFVRDITARKAVEKKLEEDAIRHRIFVEQSLDGIVVLDEEGAVSDSNKRFAEMLGYSLEEMSTLHVWDWDLRWSADELRGMIRHTDSNGLQFETRQRRKDGTFVDVDITSTGAICNGRKLVFCVCRDISQKKQAEAALRDSERVLASLMDNLPGMAFRRQMRPEMVLEFVSGGSVKIFGYDPEELIDAVNTRSLPEIHPEDREAVEIARSKAIIEGTPLNVAYRIRNRHGDFLWVSEQASPTYSGTPRRSYLEGIVYDVDEHYKLEMRQSLLNAAIEAADEAIVVTDADGNIEYVNPAFTRVTGYNLEEAIGESPNVLRSGKHSDEYYENLWGTITRGEIWRGNLTNIAKDGHEFEEQATISPVLDGSGRITHYVAVKHDMTLQRNLERQLLQSQKLEAVGILAGGIAHDFNNLLTVIIGHSHMLLKRLPDDDPHVEDVAQILETGNRAAALTRQLLAYSRKQISRPQSVNINGIIENFRKMLSRIVDENIVLTTELSKEIPTVVIDPSHVEQIILNLVVNARDAMPNGGKLRLATRVSRQQMAPAALCSQLEPGECVVLSCTDTGCGMDEATMRKVFDPFFTTKEVGKGTGLGLSTVYGIVNQARGAISISSELGKGTTFDVWLPAERTAADREPEQNTGADTAHVHAGKLICLVEDEDAIRKLVQRLLEQAGYRVIEAASGEAAMQVVEECGVKPDLLLTDVIMPGMNGKQLADEMLKRDPHCKAVFMSGYTDDVLGRNGALSDSCELIMKPFQPEELLKLIARTLLKEETSAATPTSEVDKVKV